MNKKLAVKKLIELCNVLDAEGRFDEGTGAGIAKSIIEALPTEQDPRAGKKQEFLVQRRDGHYMRQYLCPACDRTYLRKSWNFCPECGIYVGE